MNDNNFEIVENTVSSFLQNVYESNGKSLFDDDDNHITYRQLLQILCNDAQMNENKLSYYLNEITLSDFLYSFCKKEN